MGTIPENEWLALAERCEAASGPDRELDALAHWADLFPRKMLECTPMYDSYIATKWSALESDNVAAFLKGATVPPYTASIDSAMTLVGDEIVTIDLKLRDGMWRCGMFDKNSLGHVGKAATKPLAILAAALRLKSRASGGVK